MNEARLDMNTDTIRHSTLPQCSRIHSYNHTISKHVDMPKQPITTVAPRPPSRVTTRFTLPLASPPAAAVGPAPARFVGLGILFVKPGAVTAVGKVTALLRLANWLVASAVLLAYTDTAWRVEVSCEVG